MDVQCDRKQYLTCASAGYTCLVFSLFVFLIEGTFFVKIGWLAERTPNTFVAVYMAILFLFPASLAYARMLSHQSGLGAENTPEPFNSRSLVIKTVIITLSIAFVVEAFTVGMEASWQIQGTAHVSEQKAADLYANQAK